MDEVNKRVIQSVRTCGWTVMSIVEDAQGPAFSYSIGLFSTFKHPEVIVLGLGCETGKATVNTIGQEVKKGSVFEADGFYSSVFAGISCAFSTVAIHIYPEYLGRAIDYYHGTGFPVLQCLWPDRHNRFPWDQKHSQKKRQPLLR